MSIRLINVNTLRLESFNSQNAPPYAILSHTWVEDEEISFQEMCQIAERLRHPASRRSGYRKVRETCRLATNHGLKYAWVDTCCIDKSSSAELSESINSMFRWYRDAKVCFAYLNDYSLPSSSHGLDIAGCKWFTRGWCLQELIAPKHLIFYDKAWMEVGSKSTLISSIASITRVDEDVLQDHTVMYLLPVARRMSWASHRITTRVEDIAYCLLGIFDINMPMLYGEAEKAFLRLQEEIVRRFNDMSIFLFSPKLSSSLQFSQSPRDPTAQATGKRKRGRPSKRLDPEASRKNDSKLSATQYVGKPSTYQFCSMFAHSPEDFHACGDIVHTHGARALFDIQAFSVNNRGVQLGKRLLWCDWEKHCFTFKTAFRHSNCVDHLENGAIFLRKFGFNLFARVLLPQTAITHTAQVTFHGDVCILAHVTPSTLEPICNTLEEVLRIHIKSPDGWNVALSQQTPLATWDESGRLFLFPENHVNMNFDHTFTRSVQVNVEGDAVEDVNFFLHFLLNFQHAKDNEAYVLLGKGPMPKPERSDAEDFFGPHLQLLMQTPKLPARACKVSDGMIVDANIYRDRNQRQLSGGFTCLVEISSSET